VKTWLAPVALAVGLLAAACGGSGADGEGVPVWRVSDVEDARAAEIVQAAEHSGHEHCGTEDVRFLELRGHSGRIALQFVRDPDGLITTDPLPPVFVGSTVLPDDVIATGWAEGKRELWLAEDRSYAYIGHGDTWEAWGATPYTAGCD
jgi:hypothetical protein